MVTVVWSLSIAACATRSPDAAKALRTSAMPMQLARLPLESIAVNVAGTAPRALVVAGSASTVVAKPVQRSGTRGTGVGTVAPRVTRTPTAGVEQSIMGASR